MPHASYLTLILMSETLFPASIVLIKKVNPLTIGTWMKCFMANYANYLANKIEKRAFVFCT